MGIHVNKYVEEASIFLKSVAENMGSQIDENHAGRVAVSVFNVLRDRISVEESFHLISQLPTVLKGERQE